MDGFVNYILAGLMTLFLGVNQPVDTKLILLGDVMLGRSVMDKSLTLNNPRYPFEKVADKLNTADIVFANLENPIIKNCPTSITGLRFCTDPKMIDGLKFANINVVNLANNHILNYGKEGLEETKKYLSQNGIKYVGDGNLEIIENNGVKFGFLGFNYVDGSFSTSDISLISNSKTQVDVLVIGIHWGNEYTSIPNNNQKMIADKILDAGADIIAGHHPHWVQSIEEKSGKYIFYSLGNFVFDQFWSKETRQGLAIELNYKNKTLTNYFKMPIYMKNFVQPEWSN